MSSKCARFSQTPKRGASRRKAAGIRRLCWQLEEPLDAPVLGTRWRSTLEPLRTSPARPAVAVTAAIEPAASPAFSAETAGAMGQDGEATLLALVERLVERIGRVGDLFHRRCRRRHAVGALAQPRHRVARLRIIGFGFQPRIGPIDPQL